VKLFERKVARRLPLFRADSVDIQKIALKKKKEKKSNHLESHATKAQQVRSSAENAI